MDTQTQINFYSIPVLPSNLYNNTAVSVCQNDVCRVMCARLHV